MAFARFARDLSDIDRFARDSQDNDRLISAIDRNLGLGVETLANRVNAIDPYGISRC